MPRQRIIRKETELDRCKRLAAEVIYQALVDCQVKGRIGDSAKTFLEGPDLEFWCSYFDSPTPEDIRRKYARLVESGEKIQLEGEDV